MLNKKVPIFAPHGRQFNLRFPSEKRVQKPLQDIYSLFIDANLFIISRLRNCDPGESTYASILANSKPTDPM